MNKYIASCLGGVLVAASGIILTEPAKDQDPKERGKVMMVLDASGSMWGQIDGVPKISSDRDVIDNVLG